MHWVTKLENTLNNPITRKKIILLCGSIEAFLENPSMLNDSQLDSNFSWMKRVSPEEAKISKEKLEEWARSDAKPSGGKIDEWIYQKPISTFNTGISEKLFGRKLPAEFYNDDITEDDDNEKELNYLESLTPNAVQRNWITPTEFLCCPQKISDTPLEDYYNNLKIGKIFCKNQYWKSEIIKFGLSIDKNSLVVQCNSENSVKAWFINVVTFENNLFVHTPYKSCFTNEGAEKYYTIALGKEWTGGDVFDDFC